MPTIKVTQEKCKRCIYGYPCELWDELSLPSEGERCDNYEDISDNYENINKLNNIKFQAYLEQTNKLTQNRASLKRLKLLFLAWFILIIIMLVIKYIVKL